MPENLKTDLSKFDNSWYKPGNKIKWALWHITSTVFFINPLFAFMAPKIFLLRLFGAKIGKGAVIKTRVVIKFPWFLEIGDNVWLGEAAWIENQGKIKIGNNCCLSQGAMLLTGNHNFKKTTFDLMVGDITLEEGVWIGAHAIVCPGVTCKSHSVLSVKSVATETLEPYSVYKGNPAVKIRDREINN
ncbi:MAG: WcaF family extracellular polysaccharide biosynthesis acetyltransferase [Bacteroidota bacterium]